MSGKEHHVLLIDDDYSTLRTLQLLLRDHFRSVEVTTQPKRIPELLAARTYDAILLDMNFQPGARSGNEGLFCLKRIRELDPDVGIVLMTAYGEIELAVQGMKNGAIDFLQKPWDNDKLFSSLQSAVQVSRSRRSVREQPVINSREDRSSPERVLGNSPAIRRMLDIVEKVAGTTANLLLTGEHGTGKSMIAKEIHRRSQRREGPFVSVDLGAVAESLFESELFGHNKGAFTGALQEKKGQFELANGGTLFLDEIGNLTPALQAKLLVALESRSITRLGAEGSRPVDIRLICATNQVPETLVRRGVFREDLLYRINTVQLELPPLRDRGDDLLLYTTHFLERFGKKYGKSGLEVSSEAKRQMKRYRWPGNVRELMNAIERAVILSDGRTLVPEDLNLRNITLQEEEEIALTLEEMESKMILQAIEQNQGNMSAAAEQLGISRQTLYNKVKKYDF